MEKKEMKVYIVLQFDAEPYESYHDGIHKVFSSEESAEKYIQEHGEGPHWYDESVCDGYYLRSDVVAWVVHD